MYSSDLYGYYLDAHSSVSSNEVFEILEKTVKLLPNLKAITFEMLPEYLNFVPEKSVKVQLEKMNIIWNKKGIKSRNRPVKSVNLTAKEVVPTIGEWENTLGTLAIGREINNESCPISKRLKKDKGLEIIQALIEKFRGSLVVSSLKLTSRYLILKYGIEQFNITLRDFWTQSAPELFASDNGLAFAVYLLKSQKLINSNSLLVDLINYEYKSILTLMDNQERQIEISFDPINLVQLLSNWQLPDNIERGKYYITITPDRNKVEAIESVLHT